MSVSSSHSSVSIVIPTYNYAAYLSQAIRSVLRQDHAHWELIIVDDGSTDSTAASVAAFPDPRIQYIYQQNAGLSAARNTGIRSARYDFVAFLDADDEWLPPHLSSILTNFATLDSSFALIGSGSYRVDDTGRAFPRQGRRQWKDREIHVSEIVLKSRFMPSAVVVRHAVFTECGLFDTELRSSEDREMWLRIGARHRIFVQARETVRIRKHSANMSKQADRMRTSTNIVIRRAYCAGLVPRWHLVFWSKAWALYYYQNSWMLYDADRFPEAMRDAFFAMVVSPLPLSSAKLDVPPFFRLRAFIRFIVKFFAALFQSVR
jgi:glycosyltransferase involved in cell wall biosynthesis